MNEAPRTPRMWRDAQIVQLVLVRFREFLREPEALFWVFIFPVLLTAGLLAWSRAFLAPFDSPGGQLMLLIVGGCFASAFWWLHKISSFQQPPRITRFGPSS